MKYSEFLQLREILNENEIPLEDFKEYPELYEAGVLKAIMGSLGKGILKILNNGMKSAISSGVSKNHIRKLNSSAKEIVHLVTNKLEGKKTKDDTDVEGVIDSIEKQIEKYKEGWKNKKKRTEVPEKIEKQLERKKDQMISKYIKEYVDAYSERVINSIRSKEGIKEKHKEELLNYWKHLLTKINIDVSGLLVERGILPEDDLRYVISNLVEPEKTEPIRQETDNSQDQK